MKFYYIQQHLSIFLIVLLLVGTTDIKNLNKVENKVREFATLSSSEVSMF